MSRDSNRQHSFKFSCSAKQPQHKFVPKPTESPALLAIKMDAKPTRKTHSCKSGKNTQFFKIFSPFHVFYFQRENVVFISLLISEFFLFAFCLLGIFSVENRNKKEGKNYSCRKEFTLTSPKAVADSARIKKNIIFALRFAEKAVYVKLVNNWLGWKKRDAEIFELH